MIIYKTFKHAKSSLKMTIKNFRYLKILIILTVRTFFEKVRSRYTKIIFLHH